MASMNLAVVPEAARSIFHVAARRNGNTLTGIVVSAGLAEKTVKVRVGGEVWNKKVQKVHCCRPLLPFCYYALRELHLCPPTSRRRPD